jgi:hypothetical protein
VTLDLDDESAGAAAAGGLFTPLSTARGRSLVLHAVHPSVLPSMALGVGIVGVGCALGKLAGLLRARLALHAAIKGLHVDVSARSG